MPFFVFSLQRERHIHQCPHAELIRLDSYLLGWSLGWEAARETIKSGSEVSCSLLEGYYWAFPSEIDGAEAANTQVPPCPSLGRGRRHSLTRPRCGRPAGGMQGRRKGRRRRRGGGERWARAGRREERNQVEREVKEGVVDGGVAGKLCCVCVGGVCCGPAGFLQVMKTSGWNSKMLNFSSRNCWRTRSSKNKINIIIT